SDWWWPWACARWAWPTTSSTSRSAWCSVRWPWPRRWPSVSAAARRRARSPSAGRTATCRGSGAPADKPLPEASWNTPRLAGAGCFFARRILRGTRPPLRWRPTALLQAWGPTWSTDRARYTLGGRHRDAWWWWPCRGSGVHDRQGTARDDTWRQCAGMNQAPTKNGDRLVAVCPLPCASLSMFGHASDRVARTQLQPHLLAHAVLGQRIGVVGDRARTVAEVVRGGGGVQADRLALGIGHAGVAVGNVRAVVGTRQEGAVDAVEGVRHLVVQRHRRHRQLGNGEGRVVGNVHRAGPAGLAVADVGTTDALRVAVVHVLQLADGHDVALGRGLVELGQHLLPVGRGTQHLQVGLDALDEGIRTLDLHALQARVAVEHHVDHVRIRVARADQLVAHAGRVDQAIGADVADGVGACAGIDAVAVAAGGDGVVAEAAGQDVLAAGGDDGVVALAAFDVVVALAAGDAVVAVAAVQGVAAVAGHDAVVAGTAEDIVEAVAGIDDVVALATIDAVVARAALDGVLAGAGLDDEVDRHRRIDLDVVVAVAGAHGQLLALGQADVVLLAIDVEAQLAVLALGDLDLVIAAAG